MKNNKGLSYIELIIVLAIMTLLTGVAALSVSTISRTNAVKGADKFMSEWNRARTLSLAKGTAHGELHLRNNGGNYEVAVGELTTLQPSDYKVIAKEPVSVTCIYVDGYSMPLNFGSVSIPFEATSGKTLAGSGYHLPIQSIRFTNGKTVAVVWTYPDTGKAELEMSTP